MDNNMQIYTEKQKIAKIKREVKRLNKLFENMDTTKLKIVESLINEAAFQRVTLEETREIINRDGVIETYQNGENQKGVKKSSAVEVYDRMVKTYYSVIKQLCDLMPEQEQGDSPADELLKYTLGVR